MYKLEAVEAIKIGKKTQKHPSFTQVDYHHDACLKKNKKARYLIYRLIYNQYQTDLLTCVKAA